jgi:hypothetical protein
MYDQYIGKIVRVTVPETKVKGLPITKNKVRVQGYCSYLGPNPPLDWDLQVTIARKPIQIKSLDEVTIVK